MVQTWDPTEAPGAGHVSGTVDPGSPNTVSADPLRFGISTGGDILAPDTGGSSSDPILHTEVVGTWTNDEDGTLPTAMIAVTADSNTLSPGILASVDHDSSLHPADPRAPHHRRHRLDRSLFRDRVVDRIMHGRKHLTTLVQEVFGASMERPDEPVELRPTIRLRTRHMATAAPIGPGVLGLPSAHQARSNGTDEGSPDVTVPIGLDPQGIGSRARVQPLPRSGWIAAARGQQHRTAPGDRR
jgi:hypothetical protein